MFANLFLKQDEWIRKNKACFKLLDDVGVGVAAISPKMEILALNKVTQRWFPNINPNTRPICYKSFNDPPRNKICDYCPTIKSLTDGKVHQATTETPSADKTVNYRIVASPVKDARGNIIAAIEVVEDVTERKKIEDETKFLKRQLEFILGVTKTGFDIIASDFNIVYIDPAWQKIYGDYKGKKCYEYFMDRIRPCPTCGIPQALRTKKAVITEEVLAKENNRPILVYTIPFQNGKGEWLVAEIKIDISERKKLEERLKISEEKYRKVFEGASDAIFIADMKTGKLIDANAQAEKLIGRPKEEILKMNYTQLHPPEEASQHKELFNEYAKVSHWPELIEGTVVNKSGAIIPVTISASTDEISGRKVAIGIFRDMSELKKMEREKREAEALALIDPHTQLYNYRYLQRRLRSEFEAAKRRGTPLSLLMVDIDYFKSINDTYGHEYGDIVLQEFAALLQRTCRGIDVVARYEGEGFAIILPDTDQKGAVAFAERIRNTMKKHRFGKHRVRLMVSVGVTPYPAEGINSVDKMITNVDKCIQLAKEKGGNTIVLYEQLRHKGPRPPIIDKDSQKRIKEVSRKFLKLIQRNKQNTIEAVYALAHTVGAKNAYTEEHSDDMVHYATEIGKRLKMPEEDLEALKHGAMLHDIGKLGISDKILLKRGKLTKKEFEVVKKHPHIGADIIRPVHFLKSVVPIILHHHERFDGHGYGSRLKGEEIPLGARIVAIVDVYQALISNRPYRKAYSKRDAIKIIKEESGRHFDPKITKVFLDILAKERRQKKKGKVRV